MPPDPDPPDPQEETQSHAHFSVSIVEHPLAITKQSISQLVSASTKWKSKILKRKNERAPKVPPNCVLQNRRSKDPAAIEWEPPERIKNAYLEKLPVLRRDANFRKLL